MNDDHARSWGNKPLSEVERTCLGLSSPTPGGWYSIIDKQRWLSAQTLPVVIKPRPVEKPIPDGPMRYIRIYWTVGGGAVDDAPVAGWQNALVVQEPGAPRALIFCPFSLRSFDVPADAAEIRTGIATEFNLSRVAGIIAGGWERAAKRKNFPADMRAAATILARLGTVAPQATPDEAPIDDRAAENKRAKNAERMRLMRRNAKYRNAERGRDRVAKSKLSVHVRKVTDTCTELTS